MTFPTIETVSQNSTIGGLSHAITLPAGIQEGDLLLVFFATDGDNTITDWQAFTELDSDSNGSASFFAVGYKIATAINSLTITVSSYEPASHVVYRISGHDSGQIPEISTVAKLATEFPDPSTLSPTGGAKDYLWIHSAGWDRDRTVVSWEANFTLDRTYEGGGGSQACSLAISGRNENTATKNPASIEISSGDQWLAWTVAVHPVSGPATNSITLDSDGRVYDQYSVTLDSDGTVILPVTQESVTIDSDGRVYDQYSVQLSSDGRVIDQYSVTLDSAGAVKKENSITIDSDGRVRGKESVQLSSDGIVYGQESITIDSDGTVKNIGSITIDSDGRVYGQESIIIDSDGRVIDQYSVTLDSDGIVKRIESVTIDSDGRVYDQYSVQLSSDGSVLRRESVTIDSDGRISKQSYVQLLSDGTVSGEGTFVTLESDGTVIIILTPIDVNIAISKYNEVDITLSKYNEVEITISKNEEIEITIEPKGFV